MVLRPAPPTDLLFGVRVRRRSAPTEVACLIAVAQSCSIAPPVAPSSGALPSRRDSRGAGLQKYRVGQRDVLLKRESGRTWRKRGRIDEQVGTCGASGRPDWDEQGGGEGCTVGGVFELIGEALANGEEARTLGFGTFGARYRPARTARNPRTGENVSIVASTVPALKTGRTLKDIVGSGAS